MPKWILVFLWSLAWPSLADAHNVIAAVWPAGDVIEGEIGFSSGEMAPEGTVVRVLDPDGVELGRTTVDGTGLFRFEPTVAVAHRFLADLGQGHVAEVELAVDDLPAALASRAAPAESHTADAGAVADGMVEFDAATLERIVASAIQRELAPLKRELARRDREANLQSIVSGLGYIAGVFGLLFFVYARRQRR